MTFLRTKIITNTEFEVQARNRDEAEQFALANKSLEEADYAYVSAIHSPARDGGNYLVELVAEFDYDFDDTYTQGDAEAEGIKRFDALGLDLDLVSAETSELDD